MLFLENSVWIFIVVLPLVAFMYAAIGHGGASGYLALMALFSFAPELMKPTALLLNLFVSGISFYHFWKNGYFKHTLFLAFAIGSIPLAFLGGCFEIDASLYKIILGILLVFALLKMMNLIRKEPQTIKPVNIPLALLIGACIGFFSGLIGIGGGILLSPVIILLSWGKMKEAAAVSALFIWVNSAAGIVGQYSHKVQFNEHIWIFIIVALIGGYFGAYIGSKHLNNKSLRILLGFVLLLASIKLFVF